MVDEGKSNDEIVTFMTSRFGDFVLYKPRLNAQTALLWFSPFILLLIALLAIWRYLRRPRSPAAQLNEQQKSQLAELLEKKP